ncbi:hypothetical protein F4678DRAFT_87341 [Xylaria arbuscula]|nr:hypothetical protein F4678DRAFT_87341 [Xylaria arbuscula]
MPIRKEHRPIFESLRKSHHIVFTDTLAPKDWPANHRNIFESIEKIKQFKYNTYSIQDDQAGLDTQPWRRDAKGQARKLTEKVPDCLARNEATWRLACEPLIFSRLTAEIACKTCRQRVWRSEIEATLDDNTSAASKLRQRQENRDRCRCPRSSRPDDEDERIGLNKLFIDRADDKVHHPEQLAQKLPQEQKPDRVYGLRQTRNFEDLLMANLSDGRLLDETLTHQQPHSTTEGEAMLFPFLVVEAKAGNAPDDWNSVRLQTAFPIYTYLNTQQSLRIATAQRSRWTSGPLVWFFMSRGEDWRLSLAYQEQSGALRASSNPHITKIVQAWSGCITNRDDALQLFLIVDFMSDWARDVYRPALLAELRILASGDTDRSTVFTDTDIYSSMNDLPSIRESDELRGLRSSNAVQNRFKKLDMYWGNVRHIGPIKSRFFSLFITADNIQTFILSLKQTDRAFFAQQMLYKFLSADFEPVLLTINELNTIEKVWTGQSRLSGPYHLREVRFYTTHQVMYYMSATWEQTRDLHVISIADDALKTLITAAESRHYRGLRILADQDLNDSLINGLRQLRTTSAQRNFLATVSRVTGSIVRTAQGPFLERREDTLIPDLVTNIYKYHRRGDIEPELPFLRISSSDEMQVVDKEGQSAFEISSNRSEQENTALNLWEDLIVSNAGAVLICSTTSASKKEQSTSRLCVYVVHGSIEPPTGDELACIIKSTFEDCDVYHTIKGSETRQNRTSWRHRNSSYNILVTYGIFLSDGGPSFVQWLQMTRAKRLPERQGSPRGPHASGRLILKRICNPGPNIHLDPFFEKKRTKLLKKLLTTEVTAWAHTAKNKIRVGIPCCAFCSENTEVLIIEKESRLELCPECEKELDISNSFGWEKWMKNVVREALQLTISSTSAS